MQRVLCITFPNLSVGDVSFGLTSDALLWIALFAKSFGRVS